LSSGFGGDLDLETDAGQSGRAEQRVQTVCEHFGHEHHRFVLLGRRVELVHHGQVFGRLPRCRRAWIQPSCQAVAQQAVGPEPVGHIRTWQRCEGTQGAHPQPPQQPGQLRSLKSRHGLRSQEPSAASWFDDQCLLDQKMSGLSRFEGTIFYKLGAERGGCVHPSRQNSRE
jgi:hypothetical protein